MKTLDDIPPHPYFPAGIHLPHYIENTHTVEILLAVFGLVVVLIGVIAWYIAKKYRPDFGAIDKAKICWFAVSGLIHLFLEGYFAKYHLTLSGHHDIFAQIWKEYAKGDSRYLTSDTFTVVMETFTCVVDGPLCIWTAWAYLNDKPYVHVLQMLVSTAQLYGDILYMVIEWMEDFSHGPAFHLLYFWGYFVVMNAFWIVIPSLLIAESAIVITRAVRQTQVSGTKISNSRDLIREAKKSS